MADDGWGGVGPVGAESLDGAGGWGVHARSALPEAPPHRSPRAFLTPTLPCFYQNQGPKGIKMATLAKKGLLGIWALNAKRLTRPGRYQNGHFRPKSLSF